MQTKSRQLLQSILPEEQIRHPHHFKEKIRKLGLLQTELAFALGCTDGELSRWLNNRRQMPWSVEHRLEDIISKIEAGVQVDE